MTQSRTPQPRAAQMSTLAGEARRRRPAPSGSDPTNDDPAVSVVASSTAMARSSAVAADRLLSVPEACAWLGLSDRTLRRLRAQGVLRAVRIGGSVRIRQSALLRLVAADDDENADGTTGLAALVETPHR